MRYMMLIYTKEGDRTKMSPRRRSRFATPTPPSCAKRASAACWSP